MKLVSCIILPGTFFTVANTFKQKSAALSSDQEISPKRDFYNFSLSGVSQFFNIHSIQSRANQIYSSFQENQYLRQQAAILALLGVSTFVYSRRTRKYAHFKSIKGLFSQKYEKEADIQKHFSDLLKPVNEINLKDHNIPNGQLFVGTDSLSVNLLNNKLIADPVFGIVAPSANTMMIERRVQVFYKDCFPMSPKFFRESAPNQYHPCMQTIEFRAHNIQLGDYVLSKEFTEQIYCRYSDNRLTIDPKQINEHYQNLQEKYGHKNCLQKYIEEGSESLYNMSQQESQALSEEEKFTAHPFTYARESGREITFEDKCIYIRKCKDKMSDGDLKIWFTDFSLNQEATILAQIKGNTLMKYAINKSPINDQNIKEPPQDNVENLSYDILVNNFGYLKMGSFGKDSFLKNYTNILVSTNNDKRLERMRKQYNEMAFPFQIFPSALFVYYLYFVAHLSLSQFPWVFLLAGSHYLGIFLYKYRGINGLALACMIASPFLYAHYKSCQNKEQKELKQQQIKEEYPFEQQQQQQTKLTLNSEEAKFLRMIQEPNSN